MHLQDTQKYINDMRFSLLTPTSAADILLFQHNLHKPFSLFQEKLLDIYF